MQKWIAFILLLGISFVLISQPKKKPRKKKKLNTLIQLPEKQMIDILDKVLLENQAKFNSNVLALSGLTLTEAIKNYKFLLVEFYSPRCKHCKNLVAEYERTANILKNKGSCAIIAKIDSTIERESGKTYK